MEEKLAFLDEVIFKPVTYCASFDTTTGQVLSVGPSSAYINFNNIIEIDTETAEKIIEGQLNIFHFAVDLRDLTLIQMEKAAVLVMDDVLHRVIEQKWSETDKPDIFVTYLRKTNQFCVELTEEFYGTRKLDDKYQPVAKRKLIWDGETILNFYITEYKDPHILYSKFHVALKDIVGNKFLIDNLDVPEKFTLYTRRVLKNYVFDII